MATATKTAPKRKSRRPRARGDFLDEVIAAGTKKDPDFALKVDAAYRRRELLRRLVQIRATSGLTQQDVAGRMETSQAAVARIESGDFDVRGTTLDRYAIAVGRRIEFKLKAAS